MLRNSICQFSKISQNYIRITTQLPLRRLQAVAASDENKGGDEDGGTKTIQRTKTLTKTSEVEHHEKFASDWWKPQGSVYALHSMNMIRVPFIRDGLIAINKVNPDLIKTDRVLQGLSILEVGCGGGILTEQLARLHANVIGIDLSDKLIQIARDHLRNESTDLLDRVQYKLETIELHEKYNQSKYDAVVVSEVLEHVDDKVKFLSACVNTLKPGGSIFITTFNKTALSLLGGVLAAEYILRIVPRGTHDWNKFIRPIETQRILESSNCTVILVNGFFYEFWRNTWRWIPSTTFSYAMQAIKNE